MSGYADPLLGGDRNRCSSCGEYFRSGSAFSRHRAGSFGELIEGSNPPRYTLSNRRCLTVPEMRDIGMAENGSGYWVTALMSEEDKAKGRARWAALKTKTAHATSEDADD